MWRTPVESASWHFASLVCLNTLAVLCMLTSKGQLRHVKCIIVAKYKQPVMNAEMCTR